MEYSTYEFYADGGPYYANLTIELSPLVAYIVANSVQFAEFQKFIDKVTKRTAELTREDDSHE